MIVIKLFCQAGMSTSLLVHKMNQTAKERGIDCQIKAYPASSLMTEVPSADVVLLGPHLHYLLTDALRFGEANKVPVAIIRMQDYGMVNGTAVLDFALDLKQSSFSVTHLKGKE